MHAMGKRGIWIILGVALLLRAALLLASWNEPEHFFTPDSHDYNLLAHNLLQSGDFTRTGQPELFRTPLYPCFLAAMYWLSHDHVQLAVAVQIVIDVIGCLLVYVLGRQLCSQRVGLAAAAIQAVSPVAIVGAVRILSEGLFAFCLIASLVLLVRLFRQSHGPCAPYTLRPTPYALHALAAGGVLGLGCLIRPIGLPLAFIVAIVLLIARPRQWHLAGLFLLGSLCLVGPWMIRNQTQTRYGQLAGVGDYNLFFCNAVVLLNAYPDLPLNEEQQRLLELKKKYPDWPTGQPEYLNDPAFLRTCRQQGVALILAHPLRYTWVHFKTAWNIFLPAATDVLEVLGITSGGKGTLAVLQQQGLIAAIRHYFGGQFWPLLLCGPMILITLAKYALGLRCAFRSSRLHMPAAWWLLFIVFLYLAFTPGPVALPRFRVPIAPLISLAAAAGLMLKRRKWATESTEKGDL
jgi:4-amino-4-deoxy-L-arabinose transferase-like glycosyltransferase